jgi:predicted P-loop ATPase
MIAVAPLEARAALLVPVMDRHAQGWPKNEIVPAIAYMPLGDALTKTHTIDAHFAAYSLPELPRRLTREAEGRIEVAMVLLVFDVDDPVAHTTGEAARSDWRALENQKLEKLRAAHPNGVSFETRGGYRILYALEESFTIQSTADRNRWRLAYESACSYLEASFEIRPDPKCADWTRLFRLPNVKRAKVGCVTAVCAGNPHDVGRWALEVPAEAPPTVEPTSGVVATVPRADEPEWLTRIVARTRIRRATAWLEKADPAISGKGGHDDAMRVATSIVRGFALSEADACSVLASWNARCSPPWNAAELRHKVSEAARVGVMTWGKLLAKTPKRSGGENTDVMSRLDCKPTGEPKKAVGNIMSVLALDPRWAGVIARDAFAEAPVLLKQPPQREQDAIVVRSQTDWSEQDSTRTAAWLAATYRLDVSAGMVTEAMLAVAQQREVHPVRAYLDLLKWDGEPRIDRFFSTYCGAANTPYTRGVARLLLLPAVARVRIPGCKVDTIVVLESPEQGLGKSTLLRALAGDAWFADTPLVLGDKDAYQALRGVWIYELAELAAFKGREAERIKSFASSQADHYRPSYERRARSVPRQCVFVGTTNETAYLADATGARRFWPVRVHKIDLAALRRDRDQLWAEASARIAANEPWWPDAELERLGTAPKEERYEGDPWEDPIIAWLAAPRRTSGEPLSPPFTMAQILEGAVGLPLDRQSKTEQTRVAKVLHRAGWKRCEQERVDGKQVRRWVPLSPAAKAENGVVTRAGYA